MKIAVIGAKGLPALQGGIEHYCQEMYPAIARQGHEVDLYARQEYTQQSSFIQYQDEVRVISLPSVQTGGCDAFFNALFATIICLFGGYDVIHFHALGPSFFCFLPRFLSRAKVISTCHGLDWQRAKWDRFSRAFLRAGEWIAAQFAHELIVVSEPLQQYFESQYNRLTTFIPTAPAQYHDSDPGFRYVRSLGLTVGQYIIFLGRLVPEKRPDLVLQAFQGMNLPNYQLVFVGGTSDTDNFAQQLIEQSLNTPRIIFTGELFGAHLAEVMRGAGLFVLPSDLEGFPLVMLEAMREGILVASNIPPHQAIVGSDRGWLFQAGDVEDCSRCLCEAIQNRTQSETMATRAQHYLAMNYRWSDIIHENVDLYDRKPRQQSIHKFFRISSR